MDGDQENNKVRVKTGSVMAALDLLIRCLAASAVAAFLWIFWFFDFLPYSKRFGDMQRPLWLLALLMFLSGAALSFGSRARHQYFGIRPARLIPLVMLLTWWVAQWFLIRHDTRVDPTSHNLLPFEFVLLAIYWLPAYLGSLLAGERLE